MNQGRIWCVVNPTVGLPLFLGSVAVTSLIVHYSVLSNTTWFASYWNGHAKPKAAAAAEATPSVAKLSDGSSGVVVSVTPMAGGANAGETSFVITVGPKTATAQADAGGDATAGKLPDALALAASPTPK
jgi:light-harvesting protein B-800-850 alpha chain